MCLFETRELLYTWENFKFLHELPQGTLKFVLYFPLANSDLFYELDSEYTQMYL